MRAAYGVVARFDEMVEAETDAACWQTPTAATVSFTFAHSKQFIGFASSSPLPSSSLIADLR